MEGDSVIEKCVLDIINENMIQDKKRELEYMDLLKDYIVHLKNDMQKKDKFIAILLKGKHSHYEENLSSSLTYETEKVESEHLPTLINDVYIDGTNTHKSNQQSSSKYNNLITLQLIIHLITMLVMIIAIENLLLDL